jgi:hypothetical protein
MNSRSHLHSFRIKISPLRIWSSVSVGNSGLLRRAVFGAILLLVGFSFHLYNAGSSGRASLPCFAAGFSDETFICPTPA